MAAKLRFYNTLSRRIEDFEPLTAGQVKIYLCGPTVYRPSHIGHAVGPVIFDALKRYLTHLGYRVTLVVNITDVDDKLIEEAARQGCDMQDLARRVTEDYLRCMRALNVQPPDFMPRATEHIGDIIELVKTLEDKGFAYRINGDVYFDVGKYPEYGKLSGQQTQLHETGTRQLRSADEKRNASDFALWKSAKPGEPSWDSPWGPGRPGWHIECSAMSMKLLGETFDIHGGGIDLVFPHHENEIAQSRCATGKPFVKYWLHNGLTRINTKKMSKSAGQVRQINELLQQYSGETIRFFILSTHYRRPIDFSDESIEKVGKGMQTFYRLFERVSRLTGADVYQLGGQATVEPLKDLPGARGEFVGRIEVLKEQFFDALADDFNTAAAIARLYDLATALHKYIDENKLEQNCDSRSLEMLRFGCGQLMRLAHILGVFETPPPQAEASDELTGKLVDLLVDLRQQARSAKDYQLADQIRDRLLQLGIRLEDTPGGTIWRVERR